MSWSPHQPWVGMVIINRNFLLLVNKHLSGLTLVIFLGTVQNTLKITSLSVPMTNFEGDTFIILIFLMRKLRHQLLK